MPSCTWTVETLAPESRRETAETRSACPGDTQRIAVFEFHFGATLIPGTQLHTLGDGKFRNAFS